jgi:hypothetical protein
MVDYLEHGNEYRGSTKRWEFPHRLGSYAISKNNLHPGGGSLFIIFFYEI